MKPEIREATLHRFRCSLRRALSSDSDEDWNVLKEDFRKAMGGGTKTVEGETRANDGDVSR